MGALVRIELGIWVIELGRVGGGIRDLNAVN